MAREWVNAACGKLLTSRARQQPKVITNESNESSPSEGPFSIRILAVCISSLEYKTREAQSSHARSVVTP